MKDFGKWAAYAIKTARLTEDEGLQSANVIPICVATGISIATDQYGNKLSTCNYECFNGISFRRTFLGSGGCPPVRQPLF
jgi:hypothetical protein